MKVPTKNDLDRLRRLSDIIKNNKKLPTSTYKCLMNSENLPKNIKNNISKYFNHFKSGGIYCRFLWKSNDDINCQDLLNYDENKLLGEGAFGKVFLNYHGDVTKIFVGIDKHFKNHLVRKLPIIIHKLDELNIFTSVFIYNNEIAYSMKILKPIPKIRFPNDNYKVFIAILNITFKKIKLMHTKGIIHCDMKIDNIMFTPINISEKPNIKEILDCMNSTMQIVDFDGALIQDLDESLQKQLNDGHILHPTTPYFAHPWLFEKLYSLEKLPGLERLASIEIVRKSSIGEIKLDHDKYHLMIFGKLFQEIFNNDRENLLSYLKFSDYYNAAMSLLQKKIIQDEDNIEEYENIICDKLKLIAIDNNLINKSIDWKKGGGDRYYKYIEYRHIDSNIYIQENKDMLNDYLYKHDLDKVPKLKDEILGLNVRNVDIYDYSNLNSLPSYQ
jgi:serine/threonine protein kinase